MADETATVDGVISSEKSDQSVDNYNHLDQTESATELKQRIESLEREKQSLIEERDEAKDQLSKLKSDESEMISKLQEMEREVEESGENNKALQSVAARAMELETEVYRLQHDLISAMSGGEEAYAEVQVLKRLLGENETKLEEVNGEKKEAEKKVRELERKTGVLELKEFEEKSKEVRIEEEMREQINDYKKKMDKLEKDAVKKEELEKKVTEMEEQIAQLENQSVLADKIICGLKERTVQIINGIQVDDKDCKGFKLPLPAVAVGSAGAFVAVVAVVAVAYLCLAKRR